MDFFGHQDRARRHSRLLILLFGLAVFIIVSGLSVASSLILPEVFFTDPSRSVADAFENLHWPRVGWLAGGLATIIIGTSLYRSMQLARGGGKAVAAAVGGQPLGALHRLTPSERRLRNVVEEMAIASGMPMPDVYLLRDESGINAFAAGHGPWPLLPSTMVWPPWGRRPRPANGPSGI